MLVDLAPFSSSKDDFDPKQWINAACASQPPEESVEKFLAELEMKLQLLADDIAMGLEEQSSGAILRVPRAVRETNRIREDAVSLKGTVAAILLRLHQVEGSAAQSVTSLKQVDSVKQKMEAARSTLQDAAGLAKLCASVEEVFATNDLPRAAHTLASMRRCLGVVGEVPEFSAVTKQLVALEQRLERMVHPRLIAALSSHDVEEAQSMRNILQAIGRLSALEELYTSSGMRPLLQMWDSFEEKKMSYDTAQSPSTLSSGEILFSDWLPRFFDRILSLLEHEAVWTASAFPDDYPQLLQALVLKTMQRLSNSFSSRLLQSVASEPAALPFQQLLHQAKDGAAGGAPPSPPDACDLNLLVSLHSSATSFALGLCRLLHLQLPSLSLPPTPSESPPSPLSGAVLRSVFASFEPYKQKYWELEKLQLAGEVTAIDLRGAVVRGFGQCGLEVSEAVKRVEGSVTPLMSSLEAAVVRCFSFTWGSEAESLLLALDDSLLLFLSRLSSLLASLRPLFGLPPLSAEIGAEKEEGRGGGQKEAGEGAELEEEEEWALIQGALRLIAVSDGLGRRMSVFEATLRATLGQVSAKILGRGEEERAPGVTLSGQGWLRDEGEWSHPEMASLRLEEYPNKAHRITSLLEQTQDPRFHALPRAAHRISAVQDGVSGMVYEVLISKIQRQLAPLSEMKEWAEVEGSNAFDLPTFSAYPLPYVTTIGEYLLTLPQQLEPVAVETSLSGDALSSSAREGEGEGGREGDEFGDDPHARFVREWMARVGEGTVGMYVNKLKAIPSLSDKGAQQLAADIEYLCSVLSVLYIPTSSALATFQVCLSTPRESLKDLITAEAGPEGSLDDPTAKLVAKMRGCAIEG